MTTKTKACPAHRVDECELPAGHGGDHLARKGGAFGRTIHVWNEAHERDPASDNADTNSWQCCASRTANKGHRCERPLEHDVAHAEIVNSSTGSYNFVCWSSSLKGASISTFFVNEPVSALLNKGIAVARQQSLADPCAKCGREMGEHDGKKCPKRIEVEPGPMQGVESTWDRPGPPSKYNPKKFLAQQGHTDEGAIAPKAKNMPKKPVKASKPSKTTHIQTGRSSGLKHPPGKLFGYRRHAAGALWACLDLEGDEFDAFVANIKERGLEKKIVLVECPNEQGKKETFVLDGWNRARGCDAAKVKPKFETYGGKTDIEALLAYVDAVNDQRRHASKSQRAAIEADAGGLRQGNSAARADGTVKTQAERAKAKGISDRLLRRAEHVKEQATPKLWDAVKRDKVTVDAAIEVVKLSKDKQDELADRANDSKNGMKPGKARALAKQQQKRDTIAKINKGAVVPMPVGPFRVIVVDPPWPYENADQHEGSRGHMPYPPMPIADIMRMKSDLDRLVHEDGCILAMWVTNHFVHEVGRILEAWGFTHRTMLTWDKGRSGTGSWPRGRTEHVILATRGAFVHTLNEIDTLFGGKPREHSRKPDEFMEIIEQHCAGPFVELFSQEPRPNWAQWGAETNKFPAEPSARKSKILTATDDAVASSGAA